jgi:predicted ABC-type ATPase
MTEMAENVDYKSSGHSVFILNRLYEKLIYNNSKNFPTMHKCFSTRDPWDRNQATEWVRLAVAQWLRLVSGK